MSQGMREETIVSIWGDEHAANESPPKPRIRWEPIGNLQALGRTWVLRTPRGWMLDMSDNSGELVDLAHRMAVRKAAAAL